MKRRGYTRIVAAVLLIACFTAAYILALTLYRQSVNPEIKSHFDFCFSQVYDSLDGNLNRAGAESGELMLTKENAAVSAVTEDSLLARDSEIISEIVDSCDTPYFLTTVYRYRNTEPVYAGDGNGVVEQQGENRWLPGHAEDLYTESRGYIRRVSERIMPYDGNIYSEEIYGRLHGDYFFRGQKLSADGREYFVVSAMYVNPYDWYSFGRIILYGGAVTWCIFSALTVIGAVISYRRERKNLLEQQLRQNVLEAIAHDVRGPITAISGYAENLRQVKNDKKEQHYIDSILKNTLYMDDIVSKLLDYIRMERQPEIRIEEVSLASVAEELEERYRDLLAERGLMLDTEGDCIVKADQLLMEHMLENLLMNAIKYSVDGSIIVLDFESGAFTVSNDMKQKIDCAPEELWELLRTGSSVRTGRTGSGLGLSIVKRILEVSGFTGRIDVTDNRFTVEINCSG